MITKEETKTATWNNYYAIIWKDIKPPIRPYEDEIRYFKEILKKKVDTETDVKVLILGSTPELRDIVYSFNLSPTVVDYSIENYEMMGELCRYERNDTVVCCDWMDMLNYLSPDSYDIILGEAAFNVIRPEYAEKLFYICNKLLKNHGQLVIKQWIRFTNSRPSIADLHREIEYKVEDFYFSNCYPLHIMFYDFENEVVYLKEIAKQLQFLFQQGKITYQEYQSIERLNYSNVELEVYIPIEKDFVQHFDKYFSICSVLRSNVNYGDLHPIYVLSKS